jgi:cell wall-associated NlpC family hydrolase
MTRGHLYGALWTLAVVAVIAAALALPAAADDAPSGSTAVVANTDGDGLNLRDAPALSAAIIAAMPEGATVEVLETEIYDQSGMAWSRIRVDGLEGYSASMYLSPAGGAPVGPADEPVADAPVTGGLVVGLPASVAGTDGEGLNVRARPSREAVVVNWLPEGMGLVILEGPAVDEAGDPWFLVDAAGTVGWVHGGYLAGATAVPIAAPAPASSDAGAAIVDEALKHLGVGYVWAGTTPEEGFDCSGFIYFIMNTVLDNDFPRAIDEQVVSGVFVSREDLRPGDLVFFENTYIEGLSHVGIYLGDGQFVNAGSEWDNVAISDLTQSYWTERYLTARRIG